MSEHLPVVALTMGDPTGVGSEVIVKGHARASEHAIPVVVGDAGVLRDAVRVCDSALTVRSIEEPAQASRDPDTIDVVDLDNVDELVYGDLREEYGRASLEYVERAIELAQSGAVDAITTAPINKQATRMAGSEYAGHTGMLADYTDTEHYSMLLVEDDLRVTHVSTHVPLVEACDLVTEERVFQTVRVTDEALRSLGIEDPTVAVAGLNPHASDGGLLGDTEAEEIDPAIERAQRDGIDVFGPESPDTVFSQAAAGDDTDCVVAMYHDQGHIPIKMLGFESGGVSGVNVTIGLPIVRTSVDHGTAFDIAGEGIASEESLVDAVELAARMAQN